MKLAHLSDLHLGFRQYHRLTPRGINQREADVAMAFRRVIDDVISARPDVVLIAGDLFHSVRPTNPAILDSFNRIRHLRDALPEAPVIVIAGDHDTPRSVETGSILRLFEAVGQVFVATQEARRVTLDHLGLAVLCVPHAAVREMHQRLVPEPGFRFNVLLTHFELAGALPPESETHDYGAAVVEPGDLHADQWDYVALGHYHVAHQVAPNAWYSGAIEHVSRNPWGELLDETRENRPGEKGWLLVELGERTRVTFRPIPLARRLVDLPPIQGGGQGAAELDRLIAANASSIPGGLDDQIVRQVVYDVPRVVARDLNHERIREFKARALHYHLDLRRPEARRTIGVGAPGRRQPLREIVAEYLNRRPLAPGVERERLVALGGKYMEAAESE